MRGMTKPSKLSINRNHFKLSHSTGDITKKYDNTPEEDLSEIIKVESNKLNYLINENIVYNILIQIKVFREFTLLNGLDKDIILKVLKSGVLKSFKLEEKVIKKGIYPQFYFLVLIGSVSFLGEKNANTFTSGSFFGDEIIRDIMYKNTAVATQEYTVLLLISKEYFNLYLKDNIIKTNEKIETILTNNFHIFQTFDTFIFNRYLKKMIRLYPFTGKIVISNQDIADSIYIIFKGTCALNMGKYKDLILLSEGDIFGIESLSNIDDKKNLMDDKFLYNIINKSPGTIIFKFLINDLNITIINSIKEQLSDYFSETKNIRQKYEGMKRDLKDKLKEKYNLFNREINLNELLCETKYKEFSPKKAEKLYDKALEKIRVNKIKLNDKQTLIFKRNCLFPKTDILLNKLKKSNSFKNSKDNNNITARKNIMKNVLLKKDTKEIKKIILNSRLKRNIFNYEKEEGEKDNNKISVIIPNKNKKNIANRFFNNSAKSLNASNNSNNNSLFFTSINYKQNKNKIYKTIDVTSSKSKIIKSQKEKLKSIQKVDNFKNKEEWSKSLMISTFRDSRSYKNKSYFISAKKQIEAYGCTALDTMNYFNYGDKSKSMNSSWFKNQSKKINFKKCIFYETNKFNIPLLILCDEKQKINFPELVNF